MCGSTLYTKGCFEAEDGEANLKKWYPKNINMISRGLGYVTMF